MYAIDSDNTYVYIGGAFQTWDNGAVNQNALVRVSKSTGLTDSWDLDLTLLGSNCFVYHLNRDTDNSRMYVGGWFDDTDGTGRDSALAFSTTTGNLLSWNPGVTGGNSTVYKIAHNNELDTVYIGGDYTTVGGVARASLAEVDNDTGAITDWDPSPNNDVLALAYGEVGHSILVGGDFTNIGFTARDYLAQFVAPVADDYVLLDVTNQPMPENNIFSLMLTLDCGEVLSALLQEQSTGRVLQYSRDVVDWINDTEVRVELGPAGTQGPSVEDMILRSRGDCNEPSVTSYTACTDNVSVFADTFDVASTADVSIDGGVLGSSVVPTSWSSGTVNLGYPFNGQARGWAEFWDATGSISVTGGAQTYQFSNIFCFDVVDIGGFAGGGNKDTDNIEPPGYNGDGWF